MGNGEGGMREGGREGGSYHTQTKNGGWCRRWRMHIVVGEEERGVVRYENEAGQLSPCGAEVCCMCNM